MRANYLVFVSVFCLGSFYCVHGMMNEQTTFDDNTFDSGNVLDEAIFKSKAFDCIHGDRTLKAQLWYCDGKGVSKPKPLIIFSPGYTYDSGSAEWLAIPLVLQGYAVLAIDHYGQTCKDGMIAWECMRPWNRPRDISHIIDEMSKSSFCDVDIDWSLIAVIGFSLGGATALWLAGAQTNLTNVQEDLSKSYYGFKGRGFVAETVLDLDYDQANQSFRDNRIKIVICLAPGFGQTKTLFTEESLKSISIPVLIMAGDLDKTNPFSGNSHMPVADASRVLLEGGIGHSIFLDVTKKKYTKASLARQKIMHPKINELIEKFLSTHFFF